MKKQLLTLAAGLAFASLASATTITFTSATSPAVTNVPFTTTDLNGSQNISLPEFNAAWGTLTGVTIDYTVQFRAAGTIQNTGATTGQIRVTFTSDIELGTAGSYAFEAVASPAVFAASIANAANTYTAGQTKTFTHAQTLVTKMGSYVEGGSLVPYIGAGFFLIPVFTDSGFAVAGNASTNANILLTGQAAASATITYDYTEPPPPSGIPEPASMALVGGALLGAGIFVRRRK
ncbi:MAG: choice-of-anchor E domain-containing protein [Bryobacteraceae bacterium]|nr:choice-of-anchor E domain-containing protein [Bryobacteraceae bacterium]